MTEKTYPNFSYAVKVTRSAGFLQDGELGKTANLEDLFISSKQFKTYGECESKLAEVLTYLTWRESTAMKKLHLIVTKTNPLITGVADVGAEWDDVTIMRAYIAPDSEVRQGQLKYNIVAQLTADKPLKKPQTEDLAEPFELDPEQLELFPD